MSVRADWIEVPVPALVTEEMFALAQSSWRRTNVIAAAHHRAHFVARHPGVRTVRLRLVPHLHPHVEATTELLSLHRLGWISAAEGPVCTNRPIRQDYLDQFVWSEIIRLLETGAHPTEIDHRREAAQKADPLRKREEELRRSRPRGEKQRGLVTAYQEGLLTLPQLRQRIPALQKQTQAVESELQSLKMAAMDEANTSNWQRPVWLSQQIRTRAEVLDIAVRQQILRLLVKEVLVGTDTITLRHSSRFRNPDPGQTDRPTRLSVSPHQGRPQVTFCVRGVTTPPCGVPQLLPFPPLTRGLPSSSRSATGTFNHILIRRSMSRSTILRATHLSSSECGMVSKYFDRSASTTSA